MPCDVPSVAYAGGLLLRLSEVRLASCVLSHAETIKNPFAYMDVESARKSGARYTRGTGVVGPEVSVIVCLGHVGEDPGWFSGVWYF